MSAVVWEPGAPLAQVVVSGCSNGCEEKPDKLTTNERDHRAPGPQHRVSLRVSADIECFLDPKWIVCFRNFSRIEILPISCIIWHGYFTMEKEKREHKKRSQYLLAGTVLSCMFPKGCVAEKGCHTAG